METRTKLRTRIRFHQFYLTLLSEKGESYKTNANEVSYEASYKAPLTRKTRLEMFKVSCGLLKLGFIGVYSYKN